VINSKKINLSGNKWEQKKYIRYTGYPGGQKSLSALLQFKKDPNSIIEKSVKGMLPKNKLGANLFRNLHVFSDDIHKFEAQKPSTIDLNKVN
jgi:large subunit ribosomal protein L13